MTGRRFNRPCSFSLALTCHYVYKSDPVYEAKRKEDVYQSVETASPFSSFLDKFYKSNEYNLLP